MTAEQIEPLHPRADPRVCYVTGGTASVIFKDGSAEFPLSPLGLAILRAEEVHLSWRLLHGNRSR